MSHNSAESRASLRTVTFEGADHHYEITGEGAPLVFLHGLGASSVIWEDVCSRLDGDFSLLRLDLRGSGRTREFEPAPLSFERWASDVRAVVADAGLERPTLVGHSLGASVALRYTLKWPHEVRALVLMASDPHLAQLAPRMERTIELIDDVGLSAWVDDHWSTNPPFSSGSLARSPEILARYRAMVLSNDPDGYRRTCQAIANAQDLTGQLAHIHVPVLVIAGSEDNRTPSSASRVLAERLPRGRWIELTAVGHTIPYEAPEEAATALVEFLEAL